MFTKLFIAFLASTVPWLLLLIKDNPGGAFVALIMQVTVIGWPFASFWAYKTVYPTSEKQKVNKIQKPKK